MRQHNTGMHSTYVLPVLSQLEKISCVMRKNGSIRIGSITQLVFISRSEQLGIPCREAIDAILCQDDGERDGHGFIEIESHNIENAVYVVLRVVGSSASCSAISRSISAR